MDADFRYLTSQWGGGEIKSGEYLPGDKKYAEEDRWGYQYKHDGIIDQQWLSEMVSPKSATSIISCDLKSDLGSRRVSQLIAREYRSNSWDASVLVQNFQILLEDNNQPSFAASVGV